MSLIETLKEWITSFDEKLTVVLISLDKDLVMSLVDQLKDSPSVNKIVIPGKLLKDTAGTGGVRGESFFITNYAGKTISTADFTRNPTPCVIFADCVNSGMMTTENYDFHTDVEKQRKYRDTARGVLLYKFTGTPPLNGYWQFEKSFKSDSGRFVFLKRSVWAEMVQTTPEILLDSSEENRVNITSNVNVSLNWITCLKRHLRHLLPYILGTDKTVEYFLSDESMIVWTKAFIHSSYNAIYGYEAIETLGDNVIKTMFCTYMISKYKRFKNTELSEYSNQYLSKYHQYYISDDLSLSNFLLADMNVIHHTIKTKTDLMETFSGALFEVSQRLNICYGFVSCQNFMTLIGEQFSFYKRMIYGLPKTRVGRYLESYGFDKNGGDLKLEPASVVAPGYTKIVVATSYNLKNFIIDLYRSGYDLRRLLDMSIEYKSGTRPKADVEHELYEQVDNVFVRAQVDMRFGVEKLDKFISDLMGIDNDLYMRLKEKLARQFPGYDVDRVMERINFQTVQDDNNNYTMMFINTFVAAPESAMLGSFTKNVEANQKAGDDYIDEVDIPMQIKNLATVPSPLVNDMTGPLAAFRTVDIGYYNCVVKYVFHD